VGLITKEVEIGTNGANTKWFTDRGYKIPYITNAKKRKVVNQKGVIVVKIEDLQNCSGAFVEVECDGCKSLLERVRWYTYKKHVDKEGKYYCLDCARNGHKKWKPLAITHPSSVKYLVNKEDAYKYSHGSTSLVLTKCPDCGYEKEKKVLDITHKKFYCLKCSDHISFPEKLLFSVFEQLLDKNFKTQLTKTTFEWCSNYRYDFYINKLNGIICETHGLQHYEEQSGNWDKTLEEIQQNDKDKENLAKKNNIDNYVILDCRYSNLEWIKNSIMKSDLPNLLNFKEDDVDWALCNKYANDTSIIKESCCLWRDGLKNTLDIANIFKIGRNTIIRYLKQGNKLGWCEYSPILEKEINYKHKSREIICLNDNEIFNSITNASKRYIDYTITNISKCCRGLIEFAGKHPITNEPLRWQYYDEYIKSQSLITRITTNT